MATIVWTERAKAMRKKLYVNGLTEFGLTTAQKTSQAIEVIADDLSNILV